ncbi:F0F1 ATP synthase subunit delta [Terrilactibacillus sp. BCM23-1]|uniref:ATP synthase subunit delta n=1 Tax=Terrilactibacillus tamarindi TaxID=2599694 RepID=A0A6N8CN63_9BACI|nr:F0F1 ATP synthase subunit delta [Terrilactibacillus tamarindi]MTT31000.1 F0F1 ATP synthase subunit delta [Terrilactibacillus tamarindi]
MSEVVSKRYASALFEVAKERGEVDTFEKDLILVNTTIVENDELNKVLNHPQIDRDDKKALVASIFNDAISQEIVNLLYVLIDRDRENIVLDILASYQVLADKERDILDVTVTTAKPLDEKGQSALSKKLSKAVNKKLRMHTKVDDSLIGGLLLRVGDKLYDGTISGKLARFRQEIKVGR